MTTPAIAASLAKEFEVDVSHVVDVLGFLDAGWQAPYIARFHRDAAGHLAESAIRRLAEARGRYDELERRRESILRTLAKETGDTGESSFPEVRRARDRAALEDSFLPFRRPEPEVQLALDRRLGELADVLVRTVAGASEAPEDETADADTAAAPEAAEREDAPADAKEQAKPDAESDAESAAENASEEPTEEPTEAPAEATGEDAGAAAATNTETAPAPETPAPKPAPAASPVVAAPFELTPELARICTPFVDTDRDVHDESQALEGAMRVLSDRLGRNARLRGQVRKLLRKHGRLSVRPLVDDAKLGRHRALLKLDKPLRQTQGHRLVALRRAQKQRLVATQITLDEAAVLPRVRAALGRRTDPAVEGCLVEVARRALQRRLLPMLEEELRTELGERAEDEATRLVALHLRQILLTPALGPRVVAGIDVNAKGDWTVIAVDKNGAPLGSSARIELEGKDDAAIGEELGNALRAADVGVLAIGQGKLSRPAATRLRGVLLAIGAQVDVLLVNEAGLSHYANSEFARRELPDVTAPERQAISLARRLQNPLHELLKVEPRRLGLGPEQGVIGKSAHRRTIQATIESCVAHVGCDVERDPAHVLRHLPGLDEPRARALVAKREAGPLGSREELRGEGLLDDVTWTNAISFLRMPSSSEPLDRTALHPEQYDLARRVVSATGASVQDTLGQRDAARGLRGEEFGVSPDMWREFTRELSHPGRDPRLRIFPPTLLAPTADPSTLEKGQVLEGIVSNVASFGAFVDIGLPRDAMVHIGEIAARYLRDAREALSIGQVVRARVVGTSGQRVELSLKNVPYQRRTRPTGGARGAGGADGAGRSGGARAGGGGGGPRGRGRGGRPESEPESREPVRAARSRRDGLAGAGGGADGRRGKGGGGRGGPGGGRGGPGGGRGRGRRKDEDFDADAVRRATRDAGKAFNPFATYFKDRDDDPSPSDESGSTESTEQAEA